LTIRWNPLMGSLMRHEGVVCFNSHLPEMTIT